jgi:hypothetical protein
MTTMANHIEVWHDETSDASEPRYCVSLCEEDGEEVRCLSTHEGRDEAEEAGRSEAGKRGLAVLYREKTGLTSGL